MNGYFQLITSKSGTSVRLVPETDGGEPLRVNEVTNYLKYLKIPFALKLLNEGIEKHEDTIVPLSQESHCSEQEMCLITVSEDRMHATIRFYAPSDDGAVMGLDEILNEIARNKIVFGIMRENIDAFLAKRE